MIDLSKPIRRKGGDPVRVEDGFYIVHPPSGYADFSFASFATREELERDYENIPEPRKPRELFFNFFSETTRSFYDDNEAAQRDMGWNVGGGKTTRFIEWPQDAPLPDWPEGY